MFSFLNTPMNPFALEFLFEILHFKYLSVICFFNSIEILCLNYARKLSQSDPKTVVLLSPTQWRHKGFRLCDLERSIRQSLRSQLLNLA